MSQTMVGATGGGTHSGSKPDAGAAPGRGTGGRAGSMVHCACLGLALLAGPQVAAAEGAAAAGTGTPAAAPTRIGVYDSRAIAVAYGGSAQFRQKMQSMVEAHRKAKADGDRAREAELERQGREQQRLFHRQGFSTAPVDDLLACIRDRLPDVMRQAQVQALVSKWDTAALATYAGAERVDVTVRLADEFQPGAQQKKWIEEMQKQQPIALDQVDRVVEEAEGGR